LVASIRSRTHAEYDRYIVTDNSVDEGESTREFYDEHWVKLYILTAVYKEICWYKKYTVFDLKDVPKSCSMDEWNPFIKNCIANYSLDYLMNESKKLTTTSLKIMKGKYIL
jgi:hypothetical protein